MRAVSDPPHDAVSEAHRLYGDRVYRFLLRRTGNHRDAEDLAQRVFLEAAAALERAQPASTLAWLYTVAQRRFIDEVRRRKTEADAAAKDRPPLPSEFTYGASAARAIKGAIQSLDQVSRDVVVMKLLEGRAFKEIAARIGSTEAAAKMRYSRALREVQAQLEAEGFRE